MEPLLSLKNILTVFKFPPRNKRCLVLVNNSRVLINIILVFRDYDDLSLGMVKVKLTLLDLQFSSFTIFYRNAVMKRIYGQDQSAAPQKASSSFCSCGLVLNYL